MPAPSLKSFLRQPEWLSAILITAAIVWLHFYFLFHAGGFWRDEVNLINLAGRHTFADMAKDSFPILMPLCVSVWTALGLGQDDLTLRLLGTFVGLAIPAALWAVSWTARRSPPLLSLALLGLNATVINFGDSLRGYGLGSFFIVLTAVAMWAFLKNPSWRRMGILTVAAVLSVQSLYQNAVLFAAICFGAWLVCAKRKKYPAAGKILLAGIIAALSLLPYWVNISSLPTASAPLRVGFQPAIVYTNLDTAVAFPLAQYFRVWEFLALMLVGLGLWRLFTRAKKNMAAPEEVSTADLPLFAGGTLAAAVVGFAGFLWYAALLTQPWYFLPLITLVAACFEFGFSGLRLPRLARVVAFGLIAATACIAVPCAQRDLNLRFTNMDLVARQLQSSAGPDDLIIVNPWTYGISFGRYFNAPPTWTTVPPMSDHATHRFDLERLQMQNTNALQPIWDQVVMTLQSGHRVWVVGVMNIPATNAPSPFIDLPPPPLPHTGWLDTPYCLTWVAETGWFLRQHSLQFARVNTATNQSISDYENAQLFMASGWNGSNQLISASQRETNKP